MASRIPARYRLVPIVLFAIYGVYFWLSNRTEVPLTGRTQIVAMSTEQEMALGLQSYREILSRERVLEPEAGISRQVRRVGERIARAAADVDPGFEWEYKVIESDLANAFALPGGKVAVYTGIIPILENEDGLAVVMGHEIAHAIARHGAERIATQKLAQLGTLAVGVSVADMDPQQQRMILGALGVGTQFGILLPFSRDHESEADRMGLILLARACFDPREAPRVWQRMGSRSQGGAPPEWQSTHPSSETRIGQFEEWMPEALRIRREHCGD
jgi:predicted Zn-dependent protease